MPKKMRPMNVAVPVASATGRNVRALSSGIISSIANMTPPIGVLKVAAMPAPAPAATNVIRCQGAMRTIRPSVEPIAEPIWMMGPLAPDRGAGANGERRGERLDHRHYRADYAFFVVDGVHDFGDAVAARLRCEIGDQESDNQPADDGHQNDKGARRTWRREHARVVTDREHTEKRCVVNQSDQGAENNGAETGDDADDNREKREPKETKAQGPPKLHASSTRIARVQSCRIEPKSQLESVGFSPTRTVVSLTKRYGGTGRLYGAGTPEKTRPAGSYLEPWHGQKYPPSQPETGEVAFGCG